MTKYYISTILRILGLIKVSDKIRFYLNYLETAKWLIGYFEKYKKLKNINILDWGCGPGRVVRHLPSYVNSQCNYYGTDYNKKYIKW